MSGAIGPGDFVECIDDSPASPLHAPPQVKVGRIYTCTGRGITPGGEPTIYVAEERDNLNYGFRLRRFRPISGGSRGMFDHMLKLDAPNREPVAA